VLSRAPYIVPIPGTSHRHRLDENAAAVSLKISADTEAALLKVFTPDAASGLWYPEKPPCPSGDLTAPVSGLPAPLSLTLSYKSLSAARIRLEPAASYKSAGEFHP
jgi:hypothetical protein